MRAQTKENVAMADELLLSHEDETQIHHSTPSGTVCCRTDRLFTAILAWSDTNWRSNWSNHGSCAALIALQNSCWVMLYLWFTQWRSQRGVWGVQTPPIENRCVFLRLNNWQKTTFKLAFVKTNRRSLSDDVNGQLYGDAEKCRDCQCMCIHSQSHLLPIRFATCMNLLFRRGINIKFGQAKFCRKFSGRNAPTDPHTNEILNPLHYKFLATPLGSLIKIYSRINRDEKFTW